MYMTDEKIIKIKELASDFFTKAGIINFEINVAETVNIERLRVSLSTRDASFYIGEKGRNIGAFEAILRLMMKKQLGELPQFYLDINNYRNLRENSLKELAKKSAHRVRIYKKPVALEAMSAYDRRIIHTELAACPDIKTESAGEGEQRRVVVKYVD